MGPGVQMLPVQPGMVTLDAAGGASPTGGASSGGWSTVATKQRRGSNVQVMAAAPPQPVVEVSRNDGNAVELYYDQKELFHRNWESGAKQPRSVKARRKTDYAVTKRKNQSLRARGFAPDAGDFED